jgi:AraC-like DNA-binding protein
MDVLSDVLAAMRTGQAHAARTNTQAPWGVRFPASDATGCHVLLHGSCWLIPAQGGDPLALSVGDVVLIPRSLGYALADHPDSPTVEFQSDSDDSAALDRVRVPGPGATTTMLCAAYYFDRARTHPLLEDLPEIIHLPARGDRHPSLRAAVELLGNEVAEPRAGTTAILPALVDMLLLFSLRAWFDEQSGRTTTGWATALNDPAVTAALHGIHRHPERSWTVEDLAGLAGLSRAAFAKKFAIIVGQPPLSYLTWWRMTTAARSLRESEASLRSVAERAGYASEFAFAKAFKREYGLAPGRYRRQARPPGRLIRASDRS